MGRWCRHWMWGFVTIVVQAIGVIHAGELHFFEREAIFSLPLANPRSPELAFEYFPLVSPDQYQGNLGARIPWVTWEWSGRQVQFGIDGGSWTSIYRGRTNFPVTDADYLIGFPLMYRDGSFSAELSVVHISSHLGDGDRLGRVPFVYSREYFSLRLSQEIDLWPGEIRFYGGGGYIFNVSPPLDRPSIGGGIEVVVRGEGGPLLRIVSPYLAADVTWNDDTDSIDQSVQLGTYLFRAPESHVEVRYAWTGYWGSDRRGERLGRNLERYGMGLFFRLR